MEDIFGNLPVPSEGGTCNSELAELREQLLKTEDKLKRKLKHGKKCKKQKKKIKRLKQHIKQLKKQTRATVTHPPARSRWEDIAVKAIPLVLPRVLDYILPPAAPRDDKKPRGT